MILCSCECVIKTFNNSGDDGEWDPPVNIPNTEVKTLIADGTWLDTTWESRTLPDPLNLGRLLSSFFYASFDYVRLI